MTLGAIARGLAVMLFLAGTAAAHEERLAVGRVETVDATKKLLVVVPRDAADRRRLELTPETEVLACRAGVALGAIRAGATVRVKYLDKPGNAPEAQSIFVLGGGR
jgi:hypothetical protein